MILLLFVVTFHRNVLVSSEVACIALFAPPTLSADLILSHAYLEFFHLS